MKSKPMKFPIAHRTKMKDNINTDYIISGRCKSGAHDINDLAKYVFNDLEPDFYKKLSEGDFLIAGDNFGCGSSRELAPIALKALGIRAVLARSFARIFYRNALNVGLLLLECNTNYIDDGDELEYVPEKNIIKNINKGLFIDIKPVPSILRRIIDDGGVIEHIKKNGGFRIEA